MAWRRDAAHSKRKSRPTANTRLCRLVKLLGLLQSGGYAVAQMAEFLGVSRRSMYRDIRLLRDAGLPVQIDHRDNHLALDPSVRLLGHSLSEAELMALVLATRTSLLDCSGEFRPLLHAALAKVLGSVRGDHRFVAYRTARHCTFSAPGSPGFGNPGVLREIMNCLGKQLRAVICFVDPKHQVPRQWSFSIYGIEATPTGFNIRGRKDDKGITRTIPVALIQRVVGTELRFNMPNKYVHQRHAHAGTSFPPLEPTLNLDNE